MKTKLVYSTLLIVLSVIISCGKTVNEGDIVNAFIGIGDVNNSNNNSKYDFKKGLVIYFPLNGNVTDYSGKNNIANVNNVYIAKDRHNLDSAAYFAGVDKSSYMKISSNSALQFKDCLTFCTWLKIESWRGENGYGNITDKGGVHTLIAKSDDRNGFGVLCNYNEVNGGFNIFIGSQNVFKNMTGNIVSSPIDITKNWVFITFTVMPNRVNFYVNGIFLYSQTGTINLDLSNNNDLYFGRFSSSWYSLNGYLDNIRLYNRTLNEDEIKELYKIEL